MLEQTYLISTKEDSIWASNHLGKLLLLLIFCILFKMHELKKL